MSKLIEKVVAKQINNYVSTNNLDEPIQSAYRASQSTETALCKIYNDIKLSLDRNECVLFISLDLSAAFDTMDHQILLARLAHHFGITGICLNWIKSYLDERKLRVAIDRILSDSKALNFRVPQGSVFGPKLFIMYLVPLGDIAPRYIEGKSCYFIKHHLRWQKNLQTAFAKVPWQLEKQRCIAISSTGSVCVSVLRWEK